MFVILHAIHLLAVVIAVGGTFALRFVVFPRFEDNERDIEIRKAIVKRWRPIVWGNIVLILMTGLANAHHSYLMVGAKPVYWMLFTAKFVAALILFGLALLMTLPMEGLSKVQSNWKRWLRHIFELGTLIILMSAFLKYMHDSLPGGAP
jgi:uncharacterized membrane protein